jgi:hypothetical protein
MRREQSQSALVGGTSVNMHVRCHAEWQEEETNEKAQGKESYQPTPEEQDRRQASAEAEA